MGRAAAATWAPRRAGGDVAGAEQATRLFFSLRVASGGLPHVGHVFSHDVRQLTVLWLLAGGHGGMRRLRASATAVTS